MRYGFSYTPVSVAALSAPGEAVENLIPSSEDFTAWWRNDGGGDVTRTDTGLADPYGNLTAEEWTPDADTDCYLREMAPGTFDVASVRYSIISCHFFCEEVLGGASYAECAMRFHPGFIGGFQQVSFRMDETGCIYSAGTATTLPVPTVGHSNFGNGWARVWIVSSDWNAYLGNDMKFRINVQRAASGNQEPIRVWGCMLEESDGVRTTPSTYNKTTYSP